MRSTALLLLLLAAPIPRSVRGVEVGWQRPAFNHSAAPGGDRGHYVRGISPTTTFPPELVGQCRNRSDPRAGAAPATLFFLHIFKAAGSTTRDTLREYARRCSLNYRTCGSKCSRTRGTYICLRDGRVTSREAKEGVRKADVIAGHLWFGMHRHISTNKRPVYVTCLRSPITTAISGHLYTKERALSGKTVEEAASMMMGWLRINGIPSNYIKRLTGRNPRSRDDLLPMAEEAIGNLQKHFAVVGVVEMYGVFVDLVARLVDPLGTLMSPAFWEAQKAKRENPSVMSSTKVLAVLRVAHRSFVDRFNATLRHDWAIYKAGHSLCLKQAKKEHISLGVPRASQSFRGGRRWRLLQRRRRLDF